MIGALILSQLARFWLPLALLAILLSGWTAAWVQGQRLEHAQEAVQAAQERERVAAVAAFDETARQRRLAKEVTDEYQRKANRAAARADDIARRLRDYLAAARLPVPATAGRVDDPAPDARSTGVVADALGGLIRACSADAARLEALQVYVTGVSRN